MKDKVSIIAFFSTLIGFVILLASIATANENMGITALLFILPSITLNVAMRWITIGNLEYFSKEKISIIAFFAMLIGFVVLLASFAIANEIMGIAALLLILPSVTLNVAMRWINIENEELFIKD